MDLATIQEGVKRGLLDESGQLTPKAQLIQKLEGNPQADRMVDMFDRGLVDLNLQLTPKGEVFSGTREDAIRQGPFDWKLWNESGAEEQYKKETGWKPWYDPENLKEGAKKLALDTIPKAGAGAGFIVTKKAFDIADAVAQAGHDLGTWLAGKPRKKLEPMFLEEGEGDDLEALLLGELAREAMKNQALTDAGLFMLTVRNDPSSTQEQIWDAEWNYNNTLLQLDELTTAQAAATGAALLSGGDLGSAERARQKVEDAEQRVDPKIKEQIKSIGGATGTLLADPALVAGGGLSKGTLMTAKGAKATKTAAKLGSLEAAQASLAQQRKLVQASRLSPQLAKQREELLQFSKPGLAREVAKKASIPFIAAGRRVDRAAQAVGKTADKLTVPGTAAGVTMTALGNPLGPYLAAVSMGAGQVRKLGDFGRVMHAMAAEIGQRGLPFWQRVAARFAERPGIRKAVQAVEKASKPVVAVTAPPAKASMAIAPIEGLRGDEDNTQKVTFRYLTDKGKLEERSGDAEGIRRGLETRKRYLEQLLEWMSR